MKARLEPLAVERWSEEARAALRHGMPGAADLFLSGKPDAPRVPNVLAVLMHHPRLAGPWLDYNSVLLTRPALDARLREIAILRVAWRSRAPYEWLQHVRMAKQLGLDDAEIEAITADPTAAAWAPLEADVLAATDQLFDRQRIDDPTWARLTAQLETPEMVELVFVVGTYTCLAMAFNSFGLEFDPDLDPAISPVMPPDEGG